MEASFVCVLPKGARIGDDALEKWIKDDRNSRSRPEGVTVDGVEEWFRQVAKVPHSSGGCYAFHSDEKTILLRHPGGQTVNWVGGGFPMPYWIQECPFELVNVHAHVRWWCGEEGAYSLGDYEDSDTGTKGTLDLEILPDGRKRYLLILNADTYEHVNAFVRGVRTGQLRKVNVWVA